MTLRYFPNDCEFSYLLIEMEAGIINGQLVALWVLPRSYLGTGILSKGAHAESYASVTKVWGLDSGLREWLVELVIQMSPFWWLKRVYKSLGILRIGVIQGTLLVVPETLNVFVSFRNKVLGVRLFASLPQFNPQSPKPEIPPPAS